MAKKASKIDELAELIQDEKIINVLIVPLTTILTPIMEKIFKKLITEQSAELSKQIEAGTQATIAAMEEKVDAKIKSLTKSNTELQTRVEALERHSKLSNLIFHGVPNTLTNTSEESQSTAQGKIRESEETLRDSILQICHDRLELSTCEADISTVHRLPTTNNASSAPIIVSFVNKRARNEINAAKKLLCSQSDQSHPPVKIYINEHLTSLSAGLFAAARKLVRDKRLRSTWTSAGCVYVRESDAPGTYPKKINTLQDLACYSQEADLLDSTTSSGALHQESE